MAREARRQERLAQAYHELLKYMSRHWDWAKSIRPLWGPIPAPEPLLPEERWHVEALVTAYGSDEVRRLLEEWAERAGKIENVDAMLRLVDNSKGPSDRLDEQAMQEHKALPEYKEAMWEADEALRRRVRQELAGEV